MQNHYDYIDKYLDYLDKHLDYLDKKEIVKVITDKKEMKKFINSLDKKFFEYVAIQSESLDSSNKGMILEISTINETTFFFRGYDKENSSKYYNNSIDCYFENLEKIEIAIREVDYGSFEKGLRIVKNDEIKISFDDGISLLLLNKIK